MAKRKKKKSATKVTRKERDAIAREATSAIRKKSAVCLNLADSIVPIRCGSMFADYLLDPRRIDKAALTASDRRHILAGLRTTRDAAGRLSRNSLHSAVIEQDAKKVKSGAITLIRNVEKAKGKLSKDAIQKLSKGAETVAGRVRKLWKDTRSACNGS